MNKILFADGKEKAGEKQIEKQQKSDMEKFQ